VKEAAIAIVAHGNLVLTVARPEPPHEQALPGGHLEPGETPSQAMVREVAEETGIVPLSWQYLGAGAEKSTWVHVFVVKSFQGTATAREGLPVAWLTWPSLRAQATKFGSFLDAITQPTST
jgi:8-oxo-dGTP diphosphatase